MFNQTHIMIWSHGGNYRVNIGPRFDTDNVRRSYTPTAASMARLMALPQLTADWPVSIGFTMGSIFLHYYLEDSSRDLERAKHTYRGPSAITEGERQWDKSIAAGNRLADYVSKK